MGDLLEQVLNQTVTVIISSCFLSGHMFCSRLLRLEELQLDIFAYCNLGRHMNTVSRVRTHKANVCNAVILYAFVCGDVPAGCFGNLKVGVVSAE